jgi:hypothetical protein
MEGKPAEVKPVLTPYEDDIFTGMICTSVKDDIVDGEHIRLKNRIPKAVLHQIYSVFNHCQHKLDRSEGFVVLMNNDSPVWSVGVPKQWNGGAHVDAHPELDAGTVYKSVVGDAHSHPMMSAFHSGIDERDEAKHRHGLYMVFSSTEQGFSLFTSIVNSIGIVRGKKFDLDPNVVFDLESTVEAPPIVPANWETNISTKACPQCPKEKAFSFGSKSSKKKDSKSFKEWLRSFGRGGHPHHSHGEGGMWGGE